MVGHVMWIALLSAVALPVVVGMLMFRVQLCGANGTDSDLPSMHR